MPVVDPACIRVMVLENLDVVRAALAVVLQAQRDLEMVGAAASGAAAFEMCARTQPDVMLIGVDMPGIDGVKVVQAMHQAHPNVRIIVLSSFGKEKLAKAALTAGAAAYLSKDVTGEELATAIRCAVLG